MLDPIVSLRQRIRLSPGASTRLCFTTGMSSDRERVEALARKYHQPVSAARTFALAVTHAESRRRHLGITPEDALLFERLASRVLATDGSLRAPARAIASNELGQPGLWAHAISGDLPILLVRVAGDGAPARPPGAPGTGVLAAERAQRRCHYSQRASGGIPGRAPGRPDGRPQRRPVEQLAAAARRSVSSARGSDGARRARAARSGRACHADG